MIQVQLIKPGFASNLSNVVYERDLRLDQRCNITFMFPDVPSLFEERIDVEFMLSAKVT